MDLGESVATACRVLADQGLVEHILGHISVRTDAARMLIRCRGPEERGLAWTTADDVHEVDLDGRGDLGEWRVPSELPLHAQVLRHRSDVTAVVHAHPPDVVAYSLLDQPFVPLYGAYDIPGARLAANGIPIWRRSALVSTAELGDEMATELGDAPVLVLRGHGLVSVAGGEAEQAIAQAVLQAIAVNTLARISLAVLQAGGTPSAIADDDLAALPDLGSGFNVATMWRHALARLAAAEGVR